MLGTPSLMECVRCMSPHLASTAARMRDTASSRLTTFLPRTWPQDFGAIWSSINMPAATHQQCRSAGSRAGCWGIMFAGVNWGVNFSEEALTLE
jgi:hypothetical protein